MRFRFTIRHLLWLTVVVAVCMAWVVWQKQWINARHAAIHAPRKGYLSVTTTVFLHWWKKGDAPWHLRLLGERNGYQKIQLGASRDTPQDERKEAIAKMQSLFPEAEVYFAESLW